MKMDPARDTVDRVARGSYGRLVAILAARSRDIAGAEDALSDALLAALRVWPQTGIPRNPDAWLLTAACNAARNARRHLGVTQAAEPDLMVLFAEDQTNDSGFPDERLKLMFACAHPAIDAWVRTPLMLQTILGLDAQRIGGAFLVAPATMGQRLVRAKAKIKAAGIRFELPSPAEMPDRLADVLDAVYAAYGVGWDRTSAGDDLAGEAIYLGRVLVSLLPHEPEAQGLLALMLYCEARRDARSDATGRFVPLERQDAKLWSRDLIVEAENLLTSASRQGRFGRFLCEAAIQSVHIQRPITGRTNHQALLTLYQLLADICPSTGAMLGLAAVLVDLDRAGEALSILDGLDENDIRSHQPYWVTRARTLHALGQAGPAETALQTAIGLTRSEAVGAFLRQLLQDRRAGGNSPS